MVPHPLTDAFIDAMCDAMKDDEPDAPAWREDPQFAALFREQVGNILIKILGHPIDEDKTIYVAGAEYVQR